MIRSPQKSQFQASDSRSAGRMLSRTDTGGYQRVICWTTASSREPTGGKSAISSSWLRAVEENCWIMSIEADRPMSSYPAISTLTPHG
ncbi:hypothetical protein [Streptomyces sp. NPDC004134]|uniref:hypothetical protein n=1 Tax=Streptomyces sp. NPDC004134 TaxID=3364691 RepID=UPI00367B6B52